MRIRAQVSMVFHLDKCIGCHTCSLACKNIWTDRPGAEYMWWNNVETKPGTGYPRKWEDQERWRGGWAWNGNGQLKLKSQPNKWSAFWNLFHHPNQPELKDYYEPWTYRYEDLFQSPLDNDQPTAVPVSSITGKPTDIQGGPNWDDDLSGSPEYAMKDVHLEALSPEERAQLQEIERVAMMYLPRICNHCANPACVASCPSGALYKRGEDGVVLVNQQKCRGWRACVAACPYKKVYFNWKTGKSEKCILCYPRLETGQPPACFHSCVGRIRYLGVLLYDADRVESALRVPDERLVESQRALLLDPFDPKVVEEARASGISEAFLEAARKSPVWHYVSQWQLALPLHPEYRTLPMLYYVPPLLPVMGKMEGGVYRAAEEAFFTSLDAARLPVRYLARLFSAGNTKEVERALMKLAAVRLFARHKEVGDVTEEEVQAMLGRAELSKEQAEDIYQLTALAGADERFVLPPIAREAALQETGNVEDCKGCSGFGWVEGLQAKERNG